MIKYKEFIDSAQDILGDDSKEIMRRNAVSRAYYGVFHLCKDFCKDHIKSSVGSSHEKVHRSFQEHHDEELRSIGNQLQSLKNKRVGADYRTWEKISSHDARKALSSSRKLFDEAEIKFNQLRSAS